MSSNANHVFRAITTWDAEESQPTTSYTAYGRSHTVQIAGKPLLAMSADPAFRGDPARHNPEDLLVASLSGCHLLWYLHLCAQAGVVVLRYEDQAEGTMSAEPGNGRFTEVVLRPRVTIRVGSDHKAALQLHQRAHAECFIANSMNFPVRHEAQCFTRGNPSRSPS